MIRNKSGIISSTPSTATPDELEKPIWNEEEFQTKEYFTDEQKHRLIDAVNADKRLGRREVIRRIFEYIVNQWQKSGCCFASYATIAKQKRCTTRSVKNATRILHDLNWIYKKTQGQMHARKTRIYVPFLIAEKYFGKKPKKSSRSERTKKAFKRLNDDLKKVRF